MLYQGLFDDLLKLGLTRETARQVAERAKKYISSKPRNLYVVKSGKDLTEYLMSKGIHKRLTECFGVVGLDCRLHARFFKILTEGGVDSSPVIVAEVFRALLTSPYPIKSFATFHNHPSEDPKPSWQDTFVVEKLAKAAFIMDLKYIDNIILSPSGSYYSYAMYGEMPTITSI